MIKYSLICESEHEFEGWFRDSDDFTVQSEKGLLECPLCGAPDVRKAVMAPAIAKRRSTAGSAKRAAFLQEMAAAAGRARKYVEDNFDYVGDKFPDEARKIHYGETETRGIYGEATGREVKDLVEEGVSIAPLPDAKNIAEKSEAPKSAARREKTLVDKPAAAKKLN